jgi:outer membrane protein, multidrug efflux system
MMDLRRHLPVIAVVWSLASCAVGPDYQRPTSPVPEHFARSESSAATGSATFPITGSDFDSVFWRGFDDPILSQLIAQALLQNQDLELAVSRYDEARALLASARADQYPIVTAGGEIGHQLLSKDEAFQAPRSERNTPLSELNATASWELDLFGRIRRGVEAHRSEMLATAADVRAVRLTIASDVAQTYIQLRSAQLRLRIARENADNQRNTYSLVTARVAAGRGSALDDARARAQLKTTASRIAVYEASIGVAEHRLAVLIGQSPESLVDQINTAAPVPKLVLEIDPGAPGDLLRRRPDIAAAEARLHAATARVGIATANLFPRFTLAGLIGSITDGYGFIRSGSETNLIALGVDWSFLDIGHVRARIAASNAQASQRLGQYQQTVLQAMEETESALLMAFRTREEASQLDDAAADSALAAQLAEARFEGGAIAFYEVLDAERTKLQAQDAAAEASMRRDDAYISLFKALAGGWPSDHGQSGRRSVCVPNGE